MLLYVRRHAVLLFCFMLLALVVFMLTGLARPAKALPSAAPAAQTAFQKLRLTSFCSPSPAEFRVWRIRNYNTFAVDFDWTVRATPNLIGKGTAPAAPGAGLFTDHFLQTATQSGANTMVLVVNGVQQDVKAGTTAQCPTPTPSPTPTLMPTPTPTPEFDSAALTIDLSLIHI